MEKENDKKVHVTKIQNFYGNIGQHIDHIEYQVVHFDKDMQMKVEQVGERGEEARGEEAMRRKGYTSLIETTAPITAIARLIVNEATNAKTKSAFINKISEIITNTQLFRFKSTTTNSEKAEFINAVLTAYGYTGEKCKNVTDDDFQRYF